ncbi:MAG TPA: tyrosine-type recombinase/integrase, partial [Pseudolabrys sp.]
MPELTPASVEKHRPRKTRREIPDAASPGLYLIVQPSGAKSFAMRFRNPHGRQVKLTLGRLDLSSKEFAGDPVIGQPLTLVAARRLASDVQRQRALGNDMVALRHRERLERKAGGARTFSQAALDFTEQYLKRHVRRWQASARLLGIVVADDGKLEMTPKGLADRWRDRPVAEINGDDVHMIVDEVREKAVPGLKRKADGPSDAMARSMFALLSRLFRWLLEKRRVKVNPVTGVAAPKAGKARDRVLTDDEIKAFWQACATVGEPVAQCLKLLLLTGCRRDEIGKLRRAEISDQDNAITIPASRAKNNKPHVVPLPPLAREILRGVQTSGDQVFNAGRGLPWSRIKAHLDGALNFSKPFVLHDLRRTFSTGLNKIGVEPHVVEACLNHQSGHKAGVAGTYNVWHYLPEKTAALERWADHVIGLVEGRA